jgi:hypothetical protein
VHIILSDSNGISQLSAICHLLLVGGQSRGVLDMVAALPAPHCLEDIFRILLYYELRLNIEH